MAGPGKTFAVFESGDTLVEQLRKRASYVGLSYGLLEELAGMAEGAVGKYLSPARTKQLTVASLMRIASTLGLKAHLIVDEDLVRRMKPRWEKRDGKRVHGRRSPSLGPATLRRVLPAAAAEMGRRCAAARLKQTTAEERREIGRRGALIRWSAERQKRRIAAEARELATQG
jgi:hypothetical protein